MQIHADTTLIDPRHQSSCREGGPRVRDRWSQEAGRRSRGSSSQESRRWREMDSNLYGAFPVKWSFLVFAGSLFGAGTPFFVPSPAIRFAERAEGVKGPKR
jgi:hypothetical protein